MSIQSVRSDVANGRNKSAKSAFSVVAYLSTAIFPVLVQPLFLVRLVKAFNVRGPLVTVLRRYVTGQAQIVADLDRPGSLLVHLLGVLLAQRVYCQEQEVAPGDVTHHVRPTTAPQLLVLVVGVRGVDVASEREHPQFAVAGGRHRLVDGVSFPPQRGFVEALVEFSSFGVGER